MSNQNGLYRFQAQGAPGSQSVSLTPRELYPAMSGDALVFTPTGDGGRKIRTLAEARRDHDDDAILMPADEAEIYKLRERAKESARQRYANAAMEYTLLLAKIAGGKDLTADEVPAFDGLCKRLCITDNGLASDLQKMRLSTTAKQWLAENQNLDKQLSAVDEKIVELETELLAIVEKIREKARPYHEKKTRIINGIMVRDGHQRQATIFDAALAGRAVPPAGWVDPGNL